MSDQDDTNREVAPEAAPTKTTRKGRAAAAPEVTPEETPELGEIEQFGTSSFYIRK